MNLFSFLKPREMECTYKVLAEIPPEKITRVFGLDFETQSVHVRQGGYNNQIVIFRTKEGYPDLVTKLYGARKSPLSEVQARVIASDLVHYRILFSDLGIPIPVMQDIMIMQNRETDLYWIAETEQYAGVDYLEIIRKAPLERVELCVRRMLEVSAPFLLTRESLPIGFDPLPANFCEDEEGLVSYVDFMPVRFVKNGKAMVEWPEPQTAMGYRIGFWKHFTAVGIATVMLTQLCRYRPELRRLLKDVVTTFLARNCADDIAQELIRSPGWSLDGKWDLSSLHNLVNNNVYHARNLACELVFRKELPSSELENFFRLSHFEDELSSRTIQRIVGKLSSMLRS